MQTCRYNLRLLNIRRKEYSIKLHTSCTRRLQFQRKERSFGQYAYVLVLLFSILIFVLISLKILFVMRQQILAISVRCYRQPHSNTCGRYPTHLFFAHQKFNLEFSKIKSHRIINNCCLEVICVKF